MADLKELADKRTTLLHFDPRELRIEEGLNDTNRQIADVQRSVEDIADLVLFLASDDSKNITGDNIRIDGGSMVKWPNGPQ